MHRSSPVLSLIAITAAVFSSALPAVAGAPAANMTTNVEGLEIVPLKNLPSAPEEGGAEPLCAHLVTAPSTEGGRAAAAQGWSVTSEVKLGALDAVSFVGGFEPGTSGSCLLNDGNIGFFNGSELVALAYASDSETRKIGRIEPFGSNGIRIWDGDFLPQPVADVAFDDDDILTIAALASEEAFCEGTTNVPNIYGKPVVEARASLQEKGWLPVEGSEDFPGRNDFTDAGLTEVDSCSGTGFGYCNFTYKSAAGVLSVVTAGELQLPSSPSVVSYSVNCAAADEQAGGKQ